MFKSNLTKVAGATALFAIVHTALASRRAKAAASRYLSQRNRNALYRPFYLAQSAVTIAILIAYIRSLPNKTVYELRGPVAWPLRLGQIAGLVWATAAARQVGFLEILGLRGLIDLANGRQLILPEPEAQGPALGPDGTLRLMGPFRVTRHPLNLAPLPVMWLNPRMTENLLAFNVISTLYLILGSWHEEIRLRSAYGEAYVSYETSDVPFYVPAFKLISNSANALR